MLLMNALLKISLKDYILIKFKIIEVKANLLLIRHNLFIIIRMHFHLQVIRLIPIGASQ